jgi:hypothetical protein
MAAMDDEVVLSTGDFDFTAEDFEYDDRPRHSYPKSLTLRAPGELDVSMKVKRALEAVDLLENFSPLLRFLARYVLRLRPGYFRLLSDFEMELRVGGDPRKEHGSTLHELVAFKPIT